MPEPVQLSRRKGWQMPKNTVSVARPTRWGNPERVVFDEIHHDEDGEPYGPWLCLVRGSTFPPELSMSFGGWWHPTKLEAEHKAVEMFRFRLITVIASCRLPIADQLHELRGKNLACWCKLYQPCHADVLPELANRDDPA